MKTLRKCKTALAFYKNSPCFWPELKLAPRNLIKLLYIDPQCLDGWQLTNKSFGSLMIWHFGTQGLLASLRMAPNLYFNTFWRSKFTIVAPQLLENVMNFWNLHNSQQDAVELMRSTPPHTPWPSIALPNHWVVPAIAEACELEFLVWVYSCPAMVYDDCFG